MKCLPFVCAIALLFGIAMTISISVASAQEPQTATNDEPQDDTGDADGDEAAADEIDKTPSPATTATEAFEAGLAAMKAGDATAIVRLIPIGHRDAKMNDHIGDFFKAITIKSYTAGEVVEATETDDEGTVRVTATGTYSWECVFDVDVLSALVATSTRKEKEAEGLEGDALEAAVAEELASMKQKLPKLKAHLELASHTMSFVKGDDDRWYVTQPWENPKSDDEDDRDDGASEAGDAEGDEQSDAVTYACPMASHADQTSTDSDARCPKCGMAMKLVPADDDGDDE